MKPPKTKAKHDGMLNHIPGNHSSRFAPALHPTIETGVMAMLAAVTPGLSETTQAQ
ncbi:hypothetical protein [Caballeronia sp. Lep1P3]|uniref:hypothetical protein n=1 Tax=Caballeronia sp. Lep1P3 TaxID=2878150 RepID=UPI001FD44049|nr:hypothetical protein [Caballeronia sp. Lep1P3]